MNKDHQARTFIYCLLILLFLLPLPAHAQDDEFSLRLSRDFGYSGIGNNDIQGTFSYRVTAPDIVVRVEFLLDGEKIGEDTESPFRFQFNTSSYDLGAHEMQAIGYTNGDVSFASNIIGRNFVDPTESAGTAVRTFLPILLIVLGLVIIPALFSVFWSKRNPTPLGASRKYGLLGGAICTNCQRPFGIHWWGINMVGSRIDRCPHCGKWHRVQRANGEQLREAELAELETEKPEETSTPFSEEERLRKDLDDSRFEDV
jgi:hypothetical protein